MDTEKSNGQPAPAAEEAVPQILPRCPHCKVDPLKTLTLTVVRGTEKLVMFFCANPECRSILGTNVIPIQPTIVPGITLPIRRPV